MMRELVESTLSINLDESFESEFLRVLAGSSGDKYQDSPVSLLHKHFPIAWDKLSDDVVHEIQPSDAKKKEYRDGLVFLFSDDQHGDSYGDGPNASKGLVAVLYQGKFFWEQGGQKDASGYRTSDAKMGQAGARYNKLHSVAKAISVSDRAYFISSESLSDPEVEMKRADRKEAKAGSWSFKTSEEFRKENKERYNQELIKRAALEDVNDLMKQIVEETNRLSKEVLDKGEKDEYGKIVIPGMTGDFGRTADPRDLARVMDRAWQYYSSYSDAEKAAEDSKASGNISDYYTKNMGEYKNEIRQILKNIKAGKLK